MKDPAQAKGNCYQRLRPATYWIAILGTLVLLNWGFGAFWDSERSPADSHAFTWTPSRDAILPYQDIPEADVYYPLAGYRLNDDLKRLLLLEAVRWCVAAGSTHPGNAIHVLRLRNELETLFAHSDDPAEIWVWAQAQSMEKLLTDADEFKTRRGGAPILIETIYGATFRHRPRIDPTNNSCNSWVDQDIGIRRSTTIVSNISTLMEDENEYCP